MDASPEQECANPLFLRWITEWYEEACRRNAKTQYTLKKAQASLKKYPLCIEDPRDAMQLQGIGQGIADRLAKKLSTWRKEQGIPDPQANQPAALGDGNGSQEGASATNAAQTQRKTRIYIPRYRTGSFALLIGLFKTYCLYGPDYYIPKSQLIPLCEQYSNTPFNAPGGSGHGHGGSGGGFSQQYTAWSGMKTLETKFLVERQGGVKFCITEEGLEIAIKVVDVLRARNELPPEDEQIIAAYERRRAHEQQQEQEQEQEQQTVAGSGDSEGDEEAEYLACSPDQDIAGNNWSRDLPPPMPGAAAAIATGTASSSRNPYRVLGNTPKIARSASASAASHNSSDIYSPYLISSSNPKSLSRYHSAGSKGMNRSSPSQGIPFSRQSSPAAAAEIELKDLIHYPAKEYDIILIVDNREVHSVVDRNLIAKELEERGVMIEIRPLTVGDYLWIARAKSTSRYKHLPDIVLDYVVERKRMDDLCASIRDGRYKEQHSRIHGTGFTNVFYIVEGNDPEAVSKLGESAVNTAMSRIQVQHGFHLKRMASFDASLRLLRQTTCALQSKLADIYAIPDQLVGQKGFANLKRRIQARFPQKSLAMTFDAYDVVSSKSGTLSVGEIYLRMLMALRGISADKALAIGKVHPTPTQLIRALRDELNRAKALEDLVVSRTQRRLGPTMAKRVAQFWTEDAFNAST
ncbi:Crossover junction endonuclease mus81 [Dipsacomyces acuminosporus]|nr:Crossover junction endonuclease mus81 [Dipsacomyces acuminosporus]